MTAMATFSEMVFDGFRDGVSVVRGKDVLTLDILNLNHI